MNFMNKITISLIIMALIVTLPLSAQFQQGVNYRNADIRAFIEDMAVLTRKTYVIDPNVQGKVNLISPVQLNEQQMVSAFLSVLKGNGLTIIKLPSGAYKITTDKQAIKNYSSVTSQSQSQGLGNDQAEEDIFMTRVFTIDFVDSIDIRDAVKPYLHATGNIYAVKGNPTIIVSDYAQNMIKIAKIIKSIDVDKREIRTLKLDHTSVNEMAQVIEELSSPVGSVNNGKKTIEAIPVKGSNSLILKGQKAALDRYLPVLKVIDRDNANRGDVKVIQLKYANAQKILPMLQSVANAIVKKDAQGNVVGSSNSAVTISAYDGTNAIIIAAEADLQARITKVLEQLDVARPQVQVEAIIVEVSDNAAKELGVQYILAGGDNSNIPFTVQNYSQTAPDLLAAAGAIVVDDDEDGGTNSASDILQAAAVNSFLGLNGFGIGAAGRTSDGGVFGVILNALQSDSDSNILSTPSITTLNNEPAQFLAGQEIPITTGETLSGNNDNPFRTIERKEVGVKLAVTPQINDQGDIRMVIDQEVSTLAGTTANGEIITNTRELTTTVRVPDGEVLVLGGLIQENERISQDKVPFLGDLPLLGHLFKSESKTKEQTNLMIFLRPTILNNRDDIKRVTAKKMNYMRSQQHMAGSGLDLDRMLTDVLSGDKAQ